jgi:SLT domain-containing protein
VGITSILREAWNTSQNTETNKREKIQALSLAKECYSMKLDLLTNATVVNDAIRFVSDHSKNNNLMSKEGEVNIKESKELDYNEDKDQLEEEQVEKETGEITSMTNQTF